MLGGQRRYPLSEWGATEMEEPITSMPPSTCTHRPSHESPLLTLHDSELVLALCPPTTLDAWTYGPGEIREALRGERLLCPSIELSNKCNLNCPYCYVETVNSACKATYPDALDGERLEYLVRQLADAGAKTVNIIGAGEPTVDPELPAILELIATLDMRPLLATNGILLASRPDLVRLLAETRASVVLKYNSANPDIQDALVRCSGYTSVRDEALRVLCEAGFNDTRPTRLALNTLLMKANYPEVLSIFEYCRNENIAVIAGDYMPTGRTPDSEFRGNAALSSDRQSEKQVAADLYQSLDQEERESLRRAAVSRDIELGLPVLPNPAYVSGLPCVQSLGVTVDNRGTIWACPARNQIVAGALVPLPVGDLKQVVSIRDIWSFNPYLRRVRDEYDGGCPYKKLARTANLGRQGV